MPWLNWLLFESLFALGVLLFFVNFVLLVAWRRGGGVRPLLFSLLASVALLAMQVIVQTPREQASTAIRAVENEAVQARTDALRRVLSDTFEVEGVGNAEFLTMAKARFDRHRFREVRRLEFALEESTGGAMTIRAKYHVTGDFGDFGGAFTASFRFRFRRETNGWRLQTIDPPTISGVRFRSWRDAGL